MRSARLALCVLLVAVSACADGASSASSTSTTETPTPGVPVTTSAIRKSAVSDQLSFEPVEWSASTTGARMLARVSPLAVEEVQDLGGSLVWDETQVALCSNASHEVDFMGGAVSIREIGDGFLVIGDRFGAHESHEVCNIGLEDAFDEFGPPPTACLFVTVNDVDSRFCSALDAGGSQ